MFSPTLGSFSLGALLFLAPLFILSSTATAAEPLSVVRMTPQGEDVLPPNQITFEFSRPVVPLGKMERSSAEVPVEITPALECEWRWIDPKTLSCLLSADRKPKSATRYRVVMHPGIRAEDGATIPADLQYSFLTSRARVSNYWFREWRSPGTPTINVNFTEKVDPQTAAEHLFFRSSGKRYPALLTTPEGYSPGESFVVSPKEELPIGVTAELRVEPGIRVHAGGEPSNDERVIVEFKTFPEFKLLEVRCQSNEKVTLSFEPGDSLASERCDPLSSVFMVFSSPVMLDAIKPSISLTPNPFATDTLTKDSDPWSSVYSYSRRYGPIPQNGEYPFYLPGGLRSYQAYELKLDGANIADEFGRALGETAPVKFATDHRLPRMVVPTTIAALETAVKTHLPVAVQNLNTLDLNYDTLTASGSTLNQSKSVAVDYVQDLSYYFPLRLREIIPSGLLFGTIHSPQLTRTLPQKLIAQVTPFAIHVKFGHRNTLVWVTSFETGEPVSGVEISVRDVANDGRLTTLSPPRARATTDANGLAELPGTDEIDPTLDAASYLMSDGEDESEKALLFVAQKDDQLGFVAATSNFEIDPYSTGGSYLGYSNQTRYNHFRVWGATAQGIYRLGDTVQFKIFVRDEGNKSLGAVPRGLYGLKITDPLGAVVAEFSGIQLSEFGTYSQEFNVPETGAVGQYQFQLTSDFYPAGWNPMEVLISDFTPAPFKVESEITQPRPVTAGDTVEVKTRSSLYAGGPYSKAGARITARISPTDFPELPPALLGFSFDLTEYGETEPNFQKEDAVNENGELTTTFQVQPASALYGKLRIESAVRDDKGRYITAEQTMPFAGRERFAGLRAKEWLLTKGKPYTIDGVILDRDLHLVPNESLEIKISREETKASRVKGAGNAYLTEYSTDEVHVRTCTLTTGTAPVSCTFVPAKAGEYHFAATVTDAKNQEHTTKIYRYGVGSGDLVWKSEEGNSLDIVPEKSNYKVGETARFFVKNPFPGANALITLERIGVISRRIEKLKNGASIVTVPITEDLIPGFYLSIVVHSPRVDKPLEDNAVDLGKPLARMGYARIEVRDGLKELKLTTRTDKEEYRPKQKVKVDLSVEAAKGGRALEPTEVAVAVVDESVFDLIQKGLGAYDPSKGLYEFGSLDLRNYSDLLTIVGRRKFEKKGANSGGDGGSEIDLREVKKFVTYWDPAVKVGKDGKASFNFTVPDNLTSWKILSMAATKTDRFGLGVSHFKVNQPLEARAEIPNIVREGDSFAAKFTFLNRTNEKRKVSVKMTASGPLAAPAQLTSEIELVPFERTELQLPIVTKGYGDLQIAVTATGGEDFVDGLKSTIPVKPNITLETAAAYGSTVAEKVEQPILFPAEMRTDAGSVSAVLSPTVINSVDGAFKYMRDYPYFCWEQKLTKAILAAEYLELKDYIAKDFSWPGSDNLPSETLKLAAMHQAPNGGMTYYGGADDYVDPYLSAYTAIGFNWLRDMGVTPPAEVEKKLHSYLLELLRKDVLPSFYSTGMSSSVRAVALSALAKRGAVDLTDLDRFRPALPQMKLFAKAHYLQAATALSADPKLKTEVLNMLLASGNETGGKYVFSEVLSDEDSRMLASPLRENCAVLSAMVALGGEAGVPSDIPLKLVQTVSQTRKGRDHWENTQENVFCMQALVDYAKRFEQEKPDMKVVAALDGAEFGKGAFTDFRDPPIELSRAMTPDLPGARKVLSLNRSGKGRLYYSNRLTYALKSAAREGRNAGIELVREYSVERGGKWESLKSPMRLKPGELVRVDLFAVMPAARNFVVVDDAVPGGLEPVNRNLKTASQVDADKATFQTSETSFYYRFDDWMDYGISRWSFYHQELRHDSARFYSEYLPAGRYHLSYVAQVIGEGEFDVPPAKALEMYNPDTYGLSSASTLQVAR